MASVAYREVCDEVVANGYFGFALSGADGTSTNDGVIRGVKPDVATLLAAIAELELPAIETMSVADARAFMQASAELRPPGRTSARSSTGCCRAPTATWPIGCIDRRQMVRIPVAVYFHGGGWVLGSQESDDPMCRDLCVRSNAVIVSVNYRHAPEARFPAAADDGLAAVQWVAANADELGVRADLLAVAGWSAGANVAAVTSQQAKLAGGPAIIGQVLLNPATDCDFSRPSYTENADGYVLTTALMHWFWDHYCDVDQRSDPKASRCVHQICRACRGR